MMKRVYVLLLAMIFVVSSAGMSMAAISFNNDDLVAVAYNADANIEQAINLGTIGEDFNFTDVNKKLGAFDFSGQLPSDTSILNFAIFARDDSPLSGDSLVYFGALAGSAGDLGFSGPDAFTVRNKIGTFLLNASIQQEYQANNPSSYLSLFDDAGAVGSYVGMINAGLGTGLGPNDFFIYQGNLKGEVVAANGALSGAFISILEDGSIILNTPVPAAVWLLGSGLAALIGIRRKKRS
jgi:hypothetical protein